MGVMTDGFGDARYFTNVIPCTIADGQSLSNEIDLGSQQIFAISMPDAWDAANITFQAARKSGGTFRDIYDDSGSEVVVTASANRMISLDVNALKLAPYRYIKLRSGTSATPVTQTASRTINIIGKV